MELHRLAHLTQDRSVRRSVKSGSDAACEVALGALVSSGCPIGPSCSPRRHPSTPAVRPCDKGSFGRGRERHMAVAAGVTIDARAAPLMMWEW
jgi:hypothetical protein